MAQRLRERNSFHTAGMCPFISVQEAISASAIATACLHASPSSSCPLYILPGECRSLKIAFAYFISTRLSLSPCSNILHRKSIWGRGETWTQKARRIITFISACFFTNRTSALQFIYFFVFFWRRRWNCYYMRSLFSLNYSLTPHRWIIYIVQELLCTLGRSDSCLVAVSAHTLKACPHFSGKIRLTL